MEKDKIHPALLIEDDDNWVKYFQETVEKDPRSCFVFHYANDLKTGLQLMAKNTYALILLDLMLPDSQGQDTINTTIKNNNYTPIIILTTLADKKMEEFAFVQGVEDYLAKDEYDEKIFFHIAKVAINRSIGKIQQDVCDNLGELLVKLKKVAETLDDCKI